MGNREIKFRGLRTDGKGWAEGNLINWDPEREPRIIWFEIIGESNLESDMVETNFEVKRESVGQLTGLTDFKGTKIYEGDIVIWDSGNKGTLKSKVFYDDKLFCPMVIEPIIGFESIYKSPVSLYHCASICEIIGNIHENKNLL